MSMPHDFVDTRSNKLRFVGTAFVVLGIAVIWVVSLRRPAVEGDGRSYSERLRQEFQRVPLPEKTLALGDLRVSAKSASALVQNVYSSQLPIASVAEDYRQQMANNGWSYFGRFAVGDSWRESYCKGELGASLEPMRVDGNVAYSFSMSWSQVTRDECSRLDGQLKK